MAAAAHALFQLTAHEPYRAAARAAMALVAEPAQRQPISLGAALTVMAALAEPVRQLVVVGGGALGEMARGLGGIVVTPEQSGAFAQAGFELFQGRTAEAAYLCEDFVCSLPVTTPDALLALLSRQR